MSEELLSLLYVDNYKIDFNEFVTKFANNLSIPLAFIQLS